MWPLMFYELVNAGRVLKSGVSDVIYITSSDLIELRGAGVS